MSRPIPRFLTLPLMLLSISGPAYADVTVQFSEAVKGAVDPRTQKDIQEIVNAALRKLGGSQKAAEDLFKSNQTIKILCFGEEEADKLNLLPPKVGAIAPGFGETRGDFKPDGTPNLNGTTYIAIDCDKLKMNGWHSSFEFAFQQQSMMDVVAHELLHATNAARKHGPGEASSYEDWVGAFGSATEDERKTALQAEDERRRDDERRARKQREQERKQSSGREMGSRSAESGWFPVGLLASAPPGGQGGASGDTTIPWPEFIPPEIKEVKDREDLKLVVCRVVQKDGTVTYRGFYYKENPQEYVMKFDYIPGVGWLIGKPGPPLTNILYDVNKDKPFNWTRTEQELGKKSHTTQVVVPPPPFIPSSEATSGRAPIIRDLPLLPLFLRSTPIVPAKPTPTTKSTTGSSTTVERPSAPPTQETPPTTTVTIIINTKIVTTGGPPTGTVIALYEDPSAMNPETFVSSLVAFPWGKDDPTGPNVTQTEPPTGEPPTGTPPPPTGFTTLVTLSPFGFTIIHVGFGWAYTTVPSDIVKACTDDSMRKLF